MRLRARLRQAARSSGAWEDADARTIFSESHIGYIVQAVFHGPMPSNQGEQVLWSILSGRQDGDQGDHLDARLTFINADV